MELKFIWIEEYKNIESQGFNFNHSIDEEFQFLDNEIRIIPKLNATPPAFFKDNISSVTAIVGKNGSGKTNLGEFINFNLAHVTNGSLSTYFIGCKGILIIDKFIFYQESIRINNLSKLEELGYEIHVYENAPLDKSAGRKWAEMSKNKYIYYSQAFEFRYIDMGRDNLINISTSYLAFNDINNTAKHYNRTDEDRKVKTDFLNAHYINEMIRESDFILNFDAKEFIGESPTDLKISIDSVEENKLLNSNYFFKTEDSKEIHENKLWDELRDLENGIWNYGFSELDGYKISKEDEKDREDSYQHYLIPIEDKKDIFRRLFLINLLKIILKTGKNDFALDFFTRFIYNEELPNTTELENLLNSIKEKLELFINACHWKEKRETINSYESKTKDYFELIRNATLDLADVSKKKIFLDLLSLCREVTQNRLFFHYQFLHNYSSGQQNLLNLYARFFWAKNELLEDEKDSQFGIFKDRIVIFIDEGEIALHPEWQRVFFSKIINYLSELFKDRQIQLILTTHSPFVLSDIPKNNVLFLDRDFNGKTIISNINLENTFGANITDLLADSFFMNEGLIGDFSKNKIQDVIDYINDEMKRSKIKWISSPEIAKYLIDQIGEPYLNDTLNNMFLNAFPEFKNEEIKKLEEKLRKLKE